MKHLKNFNESFDENICDRCEKKTIHLAPSIYNDDLLCIDCKKMETSGKITLQDLIDIQDLPVKTENPVLPQASRSQMIYNLWTNMKHIQLFENFKIISESLQYHIENKVSVLENVFRPGSDSFYITRQRKHRSL